MTDDLRSFGLDARTVNCLAKAGIDTIDKVGNFSRSEIASLPGIGPKAVEAVIWAQRAATNRWGAEDIAESHFIDWCLKHRELIEGMRGYIDHLEWSEPGQYSRRTYSNPASESPPKP